MKNSYFEAQQVWQGVLTFTEVGVGTLAVCYRSPDGADGKFKEFWALKTGRRLSEETLNSPMSLVSVRTMTGYPTQMTSASDSAGFRTFAATQISGALDFFKHDGVEY